MTEQEAKNVQFPDAPVLAVIDIGSNSIRMSIGQVLADGTIEILEQLQRAVHLGQDTFRLSHLDRLTMQAAISILREFKRRIDFYSARTVWAVATSALREARNADVFIDRVLMTTGLEIDVIDSAQEGRLTVSAVRAALEKDVSLMGSQTLITEVGGGSTVLTLIRNGQIMASQSLGLGSIRLHEVLGTGGSSWEQASDFIRNEIISVLSSLEGLMPLKSVRSFFALGGDMRFVGNQIGKPLKTKTFRIIPKIGFLRLLNKIKEYSIEQLVSRYDLTYAEAETLVPALMVYQELLNATRAKELVVSYISMRDGLLLELSRRLTGQQEQSRSVEVIQSALAIAEKYKVNLHHARRVAASAVKIFDELKSEHGLRYRHRVLLEAAALLHEAGAFVSPRGYHKHTFYLVANSEIFGLTGSEVQIAAHVARYHRRSAPKPSHLEYMSLSRENRIIVNKLSAILRLAKAMDVSDVRQIDQLRFDLREDVLTIHIPGLSEHSLRKRSMEIRSDVFEDVYGVRIHFAGQ